MVVEGGSERGRSLGQDEPGLLGVGVGSLESAPLLLALWRRPTPPPPPGTLARVQAPQSPVSGVGIPDCRLGGLSLPLRPGSPSLVSVPFPPSGAAAQTATRSPAIKPLARPCAARRLSARQGLHRQLQPRAAADYSGVREAAGVGTAGRPRGRGP